MTPALPYPDDHILLLCAQDALPIPCHQCHGDPHLSDGCGACLGTGFIRPCARCYLAMSSKNGVPGELAGPCLICAGLHYTASTPPGRDADFNCSPHMWGRNLATA